MRLAHVTRLSSLKNYFYFLTPLPEDPFSQTSWPALARHPERTPAPKDHLENQKQCGFLIFLKILFIYFWREGKGGRREKHQSVASPMWPNWGPGLQARHVPWLGNELGDPLIRRPAPIPLSHSSQGSWGFFFKTCFFKACGIPSHAFPQIVKHSAI